MRLHAVLGVWQVDSWHPATWQGGSRHPPMPNPLTDADKLTQALDACAAALDSLEYVERALPKSVGWGVRQERIIQLRAALRANGREVL